MTDVLVQGRYVIVRRLAQGGMGEVLLAEFRGDSILSVSPGLVVVKRVLADHANRSHQGAMLREEGRVGGRLLHANIVETFFVDEDDGDPLLVMEYLSGRAMSQVLGQAKKRKERIPVEVALAMLRGAACGLYFAHTLTDRGRPLGLVHRDVSPANIFVTFDSRVKVIDFGVAKADDSEIRTSTGILKGKLGYMSPEHARGDKLTPAADLWSLGVCFWETLCAERLFGSASPSVTLQAITDKPVPSPRMHRPDLPDEVEALCMRLLTRRLEERIGTGAELVAEIDRLTESRALSQLDLGGWLAGRFPEEAEVGRLEAGRAARMRRNMPVPIGVVAGTAAPAHSDDELATVVISASQALLAQALGDEDGDLATVRLKKTDPVSADPSDVVEIEAPTVQLTGVSGTDATAPAGYTAPAVESTPPPQPSLPASPGSWSTSVPAGPGAPRSGSPPLQGQPAANSWGSQAPTSPPMGRAQNVSWMSVALLTFGALALAMGVVFSFLAPRNSVWTVSAYEDPTHSFDILVASRDAPPEGARAVDVNRPVLKVAGAVREVDRVNLAGRLAAAGVLQRSLLPITPRGTAALLLPVLIAGLGLLSLFFALPMLVVREPRARLIAQIALVTAGALLFLVVIRQGALSWPGLKAWEGSPRLEMRE